jgi:hypothetical protein
METYFARVTWNWDEWWLPSGHRARGEHGTYVAKRGYGHEEWLNRSEWAVDGWRYGFVQGVGWSAKLRGKKIGLILFAIKPNKERVFVGKIRGVEVLDEELASAALAQYKRRGWIRQMTREVDERAGDATRFKRSVTDPFSVANIRFRANALVMLKPPAAIPAKHQLRKYARYRLVLADDRMVRSFTERLRRAPMTGLKATGLRPRRAVKAGTVDPIEARMQNELRQLLEERYGREAVTTEEDYSDLRVTVNGRRILMEIKSATRARLAVRHALGQLLEYAFFEQPATNVDLVIVGQGPLTIAENGYLRQLRKRFGLPIRYKQYLLGSFKFPL